MKSYRIVYSFSWKRMKSYRIVYSFSWKRMKSYRIVYEENPIGSCIHSQLEENEVL